MRRLSRLLFVPCLAISIGPSVLLAAHVPAASLRFIQHPAAAAPAQAPPSAAPNSASSVSEAPPQVTEYTLPPDLYRKAHLLGQIAFWGRLGVFVYGVIILLLVLKWRIAPKFRDWAERAGHSRLLQALIFAPLFILTLGVLDSPGDILEQHVLRKFGLSVQGWPSWLWDWTKGEIVSMIMGTIFIAILYWAIRTSPRRWWLWFWTASIPVGLFLFFLQPLVVDPLFHKFEPLAQKDPSLTLALERMVQHAGENIPPQRMFWMDASEKLNVLNAYVTGLGASKRIVVWDTTIAKMTTPEIVFVVGHEMGHYVLNHVVKGLVFFAALFLVLFYLGFYVAGWLLTRWGPAWKIRGVDDWASLPALLLLLALFLFVASPGANAFSRYLEHQADQYALEVTHGLTPDSSQVGARAFQILGEVDLGDPDPNPVDVFLFYDHPPDGDRVHFALTYDPWAHGGHGEFVK
ncbi:MAG TPA: M48 family metallopeptidase [Verrucomicrobiae bacterium]|nr:M48 family metallopeptidase [Verrucomicrobiae bacterium]